MNTLVNTTADVRTCCGSRGWEGDGMTLTFVKWGGIIQRLLLRSDE